MDENPYVASQAAPKPVKQKRTPAEMNRRDAKIAVGFTVIGLLVVMVSWLGGSIPDEYVAFVAGGVAAFFAVLYNVSRH